MSLALSEAEKAFEIKEIPVGAIVVCNGNILAKTHNFTERLNDVTAHAEILAISSASNALGAKYLKDCTLYVTLEPCVMCAGALHWSQLGRLVYGASDEKRGFSRVNPPVLHPKTAIFSGILAEKCQEILEKFFKSLRK